MAVIIRTDSDLSPGFLIKPIVMKRLLVGNVRWRILGLKRKLRPRLRKEYIPIHADFRHIENNNP
ncbi:hypothetical protein LGH82_02055 [Mesorhizobium sp. PAMC28654]|uniref:hypothetical protein n=1 Tax=Mesorhizobium sp. PAMC28654 TaxID=2880934 RepID=UPI001D09DEFB|nr:hypothetical protein [Mesorhizobium sp. PAMC28654]UDL90203.1 hypothetical protein LGH82_02055 [Mesorhizobium sp. PAMC28654]